MKSTLTGLLLFVAAVASSTSSAATPPPGRTEVKSKHFIVLSNAGERDARRIAMQFEQMSAVFRTLFPAKSADTDPPITVLALKDKKAMQALVPSLDSAKVFASRLEKLPLVQAVLSLNSFLPSDQQAKLDMIADARSILEPTLGAPVSPPAVTAADLRKATDALDVLRNKMGVELTPVEIPKLPFGAMVPLLAAEGAAAFDDLTLSGRDRLLTGQEPFDWPNNFRVARFYSAVDYIQAMRARTLAIAAMNALFSQVDVIVPPSQGVQLTATNLTGQPAVIVPNGLRGPDAPPSPNPVDGAVDNSGGPGTPVSLTFLGGLYSDARVAAFARAYQDATGFHKQHPQLA